MRAAIARAAGSAWRASAAATATLSASALCWLSLNAPSTVSTTISMTVMAFVSISTRFDDTLSMVHGRFGASHASNRADSRSRCGPACSGGTTRTGPPSWTLSVSQVGTCPALAYQSGDT